jgi:hypothetical protein
MAFPSFVQNRRHVQVLPNPAAMSILNRHTGFDEELPDLEPEDLHAALHYAAHKLDHPVIAA